MTTYYRSTVEGVTKIQGIAKPSVDGKYLLNEGRWLRFNRDAHTTEAAALDASRKMRQARIASLRRTLQRLESMP